MHIPLYARNSMHISVDNFELDIQVDFRPSLVDSRDLQFSIEVFLVLNFFLSSFFTFNICEISVCPSGIQNS